MLSVYFIQHGDDGPIKIGVSSGPSFRVSQLQIGNPVELNLIGSIRVDGDWYAAREVELRWHRREPKDTTADLWSIVPPIGDEARKNFEAGFSEEEAIRRVGMYDREATHTANAAPKRPRRSCITTVFSRIIYRLFTHG